MSRQKQALAEELLTLRKELERVNNVVSRLNKEKELLTQENGELVVQVTATERENRQQSEVIAALRTDKGSLESSLYESQQECSQLRGRREQLEGENQDLIIRKENLQGKPWNVRCLHYLVISYIFPG